ncbi:MAG: hypothetical protein KDI60_19285, partial [Xanthomonadales bacterium]|nr:hypothetical protein [Xanthomonadales bacterium]
RSFGRAYLIEWQLTRHSIFRKGRKGREGRQCTPANSRARQGCRNPDVNLALFASFASFADKKQNVRIASKPEFP